jgi:hypothetical protein
MWIAEKDYRRYDRKNKVDRRSFVGIEEFIKSISRKVKNQSCILSWIIFFGSRILVTVRSRSVFTLKLKKA